MLGKDGTRKRNKRRKRRHFFGKGYPIVLVTTQDVKITKDTSSSLKRTLEVRDSQSVCHSGRNIIHFFADTLSTPTHNFRTGIR